VLSIGNSKGLTASIPVGGHWAPKSIVGDSALWKKVQNMAKKNKASLTINKATPMFKPLCTAKVWLPKYVASDITSLNQKDIEQIKDINASGKKSRALVKPCIAKTPAVVSAKRETQVSIGQGDGDTKWKGWGWKLLLVKFVINYDLLLFFFSYILLKHFLCKIILLYK